MPAVTSGHTSATLIRRVLRFYGDAAGIRFDVVDVASMGAQ